MWWDAHSMTQTECYSHQDNQLMFQSLIQYSTTVKDP